VLYPVELRARGNALRCLEFELAQTLNLPISCTKLWVRVEFRFRNSRMSIQTHQHLRLWCWWEERRDSNPRPPGPQPGALTDCATLPTYVHILLHDDVDFLRAQALSITANSSGFTILVDCLRLLIWADFFELGNASHLLAGSKRVNVQAGTGFVEPGELSAWQPVPLSSRKRTRQVDPEGKGNAGPEGFAEPGQLNRRH
jgi:hypothetical protein